MSFRSFGLSSYGLSKGTEGTAPVLHTHHVIQSYGLTSYALFQGPISTAPTALGTPGHLSFTGNLSEVSTPTTSLGTPGHLDFTGNISSARILNKALGVAGHLDFTGNLATVKIDNFAKGTSGHLTFTGNISESDIPHIYSEGTPGHLDFTGNIATTTFRQIAEGISGHLTFTGNYSTTFNPELAKGTSGHLTFTGNVATALSYEVVSAQATLVAGHDLIGDLDGGIEVYAPIKHGPIDTTDDLLVDITPQSSDYVTVGLPISYSIEGNYGTGAFGLNSWTLNTSPLNQPGANYPDPDIFGHLNLKWSQNIIVESTLSLKYELMDDAVYIDSELTGKWSQGYPAPVLQKVELNMGWSLYADPDAGLEICEVNMRLAHTGVDYYHDCMDAMNVIRDGVDMPPLRRYANIEDIRTSDIAWHHAHQMAKHDEFEIESTSFDAGWRTLNDIRDQVPEGVWKIGAMSVGWPMSTFPTAGDLVTWFADQPDYLDYITSDWAEDGNDPDKKYEHFWIGIEYDWASTSLDTLTGSPAGTKYALITFIFGGILSEGADGMQELLVNLKYQQAAYPTFSLDLKYQQDAFTEVKTQVETPYGLRLAVQHEAPSGYRVSTQHEAPIHFSVSVQMESPYQAMVTVITQHEADYAIQAYNPVAADNEAKWGMAGLAVQHESPYVGLGRIAEQHSSLYTQTDSVVIQHQADYSLQTYNPARGSLISVWSMLSDTDYDETPIMKLIHNGNDIVIDSVRVFTSESDFSWQFELSLVNVADYKSITRGDAVTVQLAADEYDMVVESKELSRVAPSEVAMRIKGASPIVLKAPPHAPTITKSYTTAMMAKDIVEDLLGESVTWTLVNWSIPAYRMAVSDGSAITAAKRVVEAAGGILESNKDGTISVRPKYPVTVPDFSTATPFTTLTDIEDNLSVSEGFHMVESFNKYRVKDAESVYNDILEHVPDPTDRYAPSTIRCYPQPWRTNVVLSHTWDSRVVLTYFGIVTREITDELVEFVAGEADLAYPIVSINNVDWESLTLTGLVFDPYTNKLTTGNETDYGLAKITYLTKSIDYTTTQPVGTDAQFILENP